MKEDILIQEQETKYEVVFGWKLKNYIDTDEVRHNCLSNKLFIK
jgi:hypothetical protein